MRAPVLSVGANDGGVILCRVACERRLSARAFVALADINKLISAGDVSGRTIRRETGLWKRAHENEHQRA